MSNLKVYFDAAQKADAQVKDIAAQIDTLIETDQEKALELRPKLDEATNKAKAANELYISMKNAQSNDLPAFTPQAPAFNKTKLGDNFGGALAAYLRDGDTGGVRQYLGKDGVTIRNASNDTDMNIGTAADGGNAVPTGFYQQVIARRDEMALHAKLGVRRIPGTGLTVNVPIDGEDDGEFVSTNEAAAFDRDAPALGTKAFTKVKNSKKIELSLELLEDEDAQLMNFIMDFVARGQAKTMNNLLLTEVASNGTSLKSFAATGAIASGELEGMAYNDALAAYLDDSASVAWVTRPATYGAIASLSGNARLYVGTPQGGNTGAPTLLGSPVHFSNKVAALGASAKSIYFGNWNFVGYREDPGFTLLRDPYSAAGTGQVRLWMYFRTVFGVLQSEAIGYGAQAAS